jgi:ABC-type multidrug transport system ATPase subunit
MSRRPLRLQARASDNAGAILAFTKFFRVLLQTAILGAGAYLAIAHEISAGMMIAASIIIGRALQPIEVTVGNWKGFLAARESLARMKKLFQAAGEEPSRMPLPRPNGIMSVENLVAAPPGGGRAVLKSVSFALAAGETLGVVGPSAAGKSSLARVLVGVWRSAGGAVRLDGFELSHWNPHELGRHIGYLPQDVELFAGSVAENIARFGAVDKDAVISAAELAGCHELIQNLPDGYNTNIGEAGQILSGGQRQRIALARCLYGDPSLVVLDEPNANLDSVGEEALVQAILRLKAAGVTVVLITHKVNILSILDRILLMGDGMAQVYGPRDAVLRRLTSPKVVRTDGALPHSRTPRTARAGLARYDGFPWPHGRRRALVAHRGAGYALIGFTFGGLGLWAMVAKIDRAVAAPGVVSLETNRKTVQHYEGGRVREILVKEGQAVEQGAVLFRLENIEAKANFETIRHDLDAYLATEARLVAERDQKPEIAWPAELAERSADASVAQALNDETAEFNKSLASLKNQIEVMESRIRQIGDEINGTELQKKSAEGQIDFINKELVGLRELDQKKLIPTARLYVAEIERERLQGVIGESIASIAKSNGEIG